MRFPWLRFSVAALILSGFGSTSWGQTTDTTRFLAVKSWTGTFTVSTIFSGSADLGAGLTGTWKVSRTGSGTVKFDKDPRLSGWWGGTTNAKISIQDEFTLSDRNSCTLIFSDKLETSKSMHGHLSLDSGPTFTLFADEFAVDVPVIQNDCGPPLISPGSLLWYPGSIQMKLPLPTAGFHLQGSKSFPYALIFSPLPGVPPPADDLTTLTWDIQGQTEDLEVVVSAAGYDAWRPQAGAAGNASIGGASEKTPGNTITFTAKLQAKDGSTPALRAKKFTYELTSSKVPGIAMNYPPKSMVLGDPDLQMDPKSNPALTVRGAFGDTAASADGLYLTSPPVTITSYDWGGYGTLKITAILNDGSEVVGHLDGDAAQEEVRIPKRDIGSHIADRWKADHGMKGKSDLDDSETDPVGDGHPGDGLSLYEEYRGFYENGKRIEGDPNRKELFVSDRDNNNEGGIQLYASLTGILVHSEVGMTEMLDGDSVINFNFDPDSNIVAQHGIILKTDPNRRGSAETLRRETGKTGGPKCLSRNKVIT